MFNALVTGVNEGLVMEARYCSRTLHQTVPTSTVPNVLQLQLRQLRQQHGQLVHCSRRAGEDTTAHLERAQRVMQRVQEGQRPESIDSGEREFGQAREVLQYPFQFLAIAAADTLWSSAVTQR